MPRFSSKIILTLSVCSITAVASSSRGLPIDEDSKKIRLCVDVEIGNGLSTSFDKDADEQNRSHQLLVKLLKLAKRDKANIPVFNPQWSIVAFNDHIACQAWTIPIVRLKFDKSAVADGFTTAVFIKIESNIISKKYTGYASDIKSHHLVISSQDNYIGQELELRAAEIYPIIRSLIKK